MKLSGSFSAKVVREAIGKMTKALWKHVNAQLVQVVSIQRVAKSLHRSTKSTNVDTKRNDIVVLSNKINWF